MSGSGNTNENESLRCAILNGDRAGEVLSIARGEHRLGRSRSNDVRINDRRVARESHAVLRVDDDVWLRPGEAQSPIALNGQPITSEVSLQQGDVISLNGMEMSIEIPGQSSDFATSPSRRQYAEPTGGLPDVSRKVAASPVEPQTAPPKKAAADPAPVHGMTMTFVRPKGGARVSDTGGTMRGGDNPPTQMMSNQDFRGMDKPDPAKQGRNKTFLAVALLIGVLVAAAAVFMMPEEVEVVPELNAQHVEHDFGFRFRYPDRWRFAQAEGAVRVMENPGAPQSGALIEARFERNEENLYQGLRAGFERYLIDSRTRRPARRVTQHRPFRWPGGLAILYEYSEQDRRGRGFYLLNGSDRIVLECSVPVGQAGLFNDFINNVLRSSSFVTGQDVVDYDLPTTELRAYALSNPGELEQRAVQQYRQAQELVRRRDVDPSNLYNALKLCEASVQALSVLPERADLFREVFRQLRDTSRMLNAELRDAEFRIRYQDRANNRQQVRIELQRYLRILPDEQDARHQRIRNRLNTMR